MITMIVSHFRFPLVICWAAHQAEGTLVLQFAGILRLR